MKIFAGTSNPELAEKIASSLGTTVTAAEITRFADGECRVRVQEDAAGKDVVVVQSLSEIADMHLMELCLLGSALRDLDARRITAVIPWLGYSKQDRAFRTGEAVSVQLVARFIESAGFDRVIACELHSPHVLSYFRIPIVEVDTHTQLVSALHSQSGFNPAQAIVASPDTGGTARSERFAKDLGLAVVHIKKERDRDNGAITVVGMDGDVNGKTVILFDDIINTGDTAAATSEFVKKNGARAVYFLATHAVLSHGAVDMLQKSSIDRITVTDTIRMTPERLLKGMEIVSVAPAIARAIQS